MRCSVPKFETAVLLSHTEGSSDDEEAALAGEAAVADRSGSRKQDGAEDLFEGLDAILSGGGAAAQPDLTANCGGGGFAAAAGGPDRGQRQAAAGGGNSGSRKQQRDRAPQLSEHRDFAKHAAKLPPEVKALSICFCTELLLTGGSTDNTCNIPPAEFHLIAALAVTAQLADCCLI